MPRYTAQPGDLELIVETLSEGIGARMAYDVSVRSRQLTLSLEGDPLTPDSLSGEVSLPVSSFEAHALHRNKSRAPAELSPSDARQIGEKTQAKLTEAFGSQIRLELSAESKAGALVVLARVKGALIRLEVSREDTADGALRISASGHASLAALGVPKVKAPLGLMVVADRVALKVTGRLRPV